ncbi:MAG: hypothetical protein IKX70_01705 [Treponema sp.]|nr:hypothetical protein [Treponema sp.]
MKKYILFYIIILFLTLPLFAQASIKLKASQELYYTEYEEAVITPSDNGIYPVRLTVTVESADRTLYVKIYRSTNAAGPFTLVIDSMQPNSEYFDLYDATPMQPGTKYYYQAVLGKGDLQTSILAQKSNISIGWGALTHEAFYVFFNTTIKKSYKKMTLMNNPSALKKLGTEETTGDKSGKFLYNAKIKGIGGLATMTYQNYSDDNLVFFTGDMITQADMFNSGKMDGFMQMTGMYNGTIYFDKVTIKEAKANSGTYGIKPQNAPRKEIEYSWNFVE